MTGQIAPQYQDIEAALARIAGGVHQTPVMQSHLLNEHAGAEVFFKCEHLQRVGAFKARGALNAVLSLSDEEAARGVATHSSGNHGAALAMAASQRGIPAHIVMPSNAPQVKKDAVAAYGGLIIECEPTQQARAAGLELVLEHTGANAVHPFMDSRVIAGQGTVAMELLQQVAELDVIAVPVGGGGLLAGTAIAAKHINPKIEVIAVEPEGADDAFRSFGLGELQGNASVNTIADGLRTSLGELNFDIIRKHVDTIVTVPDALIIEAMKLMWTRTKQVVEPSGVVSFAGVLEHPERFRGRRAGVVITGGNVDLDALPW
ncbi:serine/threonine dehydratase [Halioglobus japonicus]|uniref:Serine dehydratase n=2 Tax=Halioglobus japonicus TaxID=930805 RepID=A0AAP8MCA9_9GAMM|nr:pyridoxal-phosphate dependent enzyme [Halioglobus japonicus]PLW85182.1 serine dehydratase [Halioglobus japonicus]GHD19886.1 serine/threonine dehydratase [Halioglobus japonicus]